MLERYELVRLLGSGAAGDVYLARDRLLDGREVALKRIRVAVDEALRHAFEREFATMASLSVAGVAQVYDFGLTVEDGGVRPFYTRAFIDGRPLDQVGRLVPPAERIRLFCKVAQVIAPLHRVGVVHGDIKPGNAIIDAADDAHVIDFGLARVLGRDRSEGATGGTLPFMAPELLRGDPPSVQSDVFALGATLWLLLTGDLPFGRRGLLDVAKPRPLELPEGAAPTTLMALEVARRALAADPLDRLPTVDELLVALSRTEPETQREAPRRVFVPPRPRGHAELLQRLQAAHGSERIALLAGPSGSGKSLLLRELKWRLQIRGTHVLEVAGSGGDMVALLSALCRQLEVALGSDARSSSARRAYSAIVEGRVDGTGFSDALADALGALSGGQPVVLLIDDLDHAQATVGAVLRSALFAEAARSVAIIASASDAGAPAVRKLEPAITLAVPPLAAGDLRALVIDALGPVDVSVIEALGEHTQGLPAALMDALASLFELAAPTVADVRRLPSAGAGLALARARLERVPAEGHRLLRLLALLGRGVPLEWLRNAFERLQRGADERGAKDDGGQALEAVLLQCERAGLLSRRSDGVALADSALEQALLASLGQDGARALATSLFASGANEGLPLPLCARMAVIADDAVRVCELVPKAGEQLAALGAHAAAAELYDALVRCSSGPLQQNAQLSLARCLQASGELERAVELGGTMLASDALAADLRVEVALVVAQALSELGRFEEAVTTLSSMPPVERSANARVQRELARVHQRRGDYDALLAVTEAGLACADDDIVRSELLCRRGMVAAYRADHEAAREYMEEAVGLARRGGSPRDEANALANLAIAQFRTGDLQVARESFAQCLEIARRLGDVSSMANFAQNLGGVLFCLGEHAAAAEHYEMAAALARRSGRSLTRVQALSNLAQVHLYFGLYENARAELAYVIEQAKAASHKYIHAQATGLLAELAARTGDLDRALILHDDAIAQYAALGHMREGVDHYVDAAEALLDRGGAADASAAAARLGAARELRGQGSLGDYQLRLDLQLSRARLASGDAEGALGSLHSVIESARQTRNRDVEWCALSAAALAQEALGAEFAARRYHRQAVEVLEEIALRIPREHREAFWHDPRRRAARDRAHAAEGGSRVPSTTGSGELAALLGDVRAERLLDIIKRLASEHDLDRLLQRITESAVDLSGAERGFVLLVDAKGQLERRTMEVAKSQAPDPHAAFSRSIAEAVLIDGEAIVSVDAARDGRLNEYHSVHKLMLRSVACLPIRGRLGTVGVLYLEHRHSRGRFSDSSVALLHAFADQAAIALENARLMQENLRRQKELESANAALAKAKDELEELLSARTDALLDAQRELSRARRVARTRATRHGMVGQSPAMLRVFDAIDRVQGAKVPVIIDGESGTGKELVARAIHEAGPRAKGPFVAVNCGSVPESLLESELFGHVEGAFSGAERNRRGMIARASAGTLFLDEVGDMPPRMQIDLLRVLQEGTVCKVGGEEEEKIDVRFIAASNRSLTELVQMQRFREDLYYRLNVVGITLPPLRERREDIPLLCQHFLETFAARDGLPEKRLSRDAHERLVAHPLPGNVRQLEHLLLQAWVMVEGSTIEAADLALDGDLDDDEAELSVEAARPSVPANLKDFRENERRNILAALEAHGWNRARAAKALGMPRRTFYRRLQEHSIL